MSYTVQSGWQEVHMSEHDDFEEAVAVARDLVRLHPDAVASVQGVGISVNVWAVTEEVPA